MKQANGVSGSKQSTLPISLVGQNREKRNRIEFQVPSKEAEVKMNEEGMMKRKQIRRRNEISIDGSSINSRCQITGVSFNKKTATTISANKMQQTNNCCKHSNRWLSSMRLVTTTSGSNSKIRRNSTNSSVERRVNKWLAVCSKWPTQMATCQATIILLVLLICNNQINCDQQHQSTVLFNETTTSNSLQVAANSTQTLQNTNGQQLNNISLAEYKQRPNPASSEYDTSTKISYDMQHELTPASTTAATATTTTTTTTTTIQPSTVDGEPLARQVQSETGGPNANQAVVGNLTTTTSVQVATKANATLIELANERKPFAEVDSSEQIFTVHQKMAADFDPSSQNGGSDLIGQQSGEQPAAEYLIGVTGEAASGTASGAESSLSGSSLDETTLDLDALSATSSSIISRHGRASNLPGNSYTAPASSRLSAYTPMLLQNSRTHQSRQETGGQLSMATNQADQQHQQRNFATTTSTRSPPSGPFDPIIVCYLGSWSVYRPSLAKFTPENINPFLCTHIIYAFAGLSSKFELRPFDSYNDITQGGYRKFTGLKEYNKQLKTLIAVGGWNEGSARFSKLVASPELRANFIQSTIRFLREHKFDGIDLDWEYPGFRDGSSQDDKEKYAALIKELRLAFDKDKENHPNSPKLLLSVAVPAGQDNIDNGFDVPTISKNVDFMNVLTYDYYTAFDKQTNHHAPLSIREGQLTDASSKRLNIDWTINYYLSLGAAPNKLILGVPTYGRSYTLSQALSTDSAPQLTGDEDSYELANKIGLGARADSPGDEGPATREKGYLAYYEICQKIDNEQWLKQKFASDNQGPLAFRGNQWVSYDDVESAIMKTQYVIRNRLGGVMVWTLDNDDFRGSCPSSRQQENPLITAIRDTIIKSVTGQSPNRAISTTTSTSTTTTTTTSTTTTTPPPPPPTETIEEDSNELAASPSGESASASEASSSLIRNLANGARQAPTTPDPGAAFTCKDEGFFPNPKDCKKYFWCLDSGPANLGVVAHAFTCPSGLFFNSQTEGCDYPEKVSCKQQRSSTLAPRTTSTSTTTTTTTTQAPPPARSASNPSSPERNRMVVKKRKPSSTTTSTTTTPAPSSTTAQSLMAVTTTLVPSIPVTNDINELVASMLQNPQFASVINSQLRLSQQKPQLGAPSNDGNSLQQVNPSGNNKQSIDDDFAASLANAEAAVAESSAGGQQEGSNGANSKQAQDLLQLLNLIQSLGGVDKITPYLSNQAGSGGQDSQTMAIKLNELGSNRVVRNETYQPTESEGAILEGLFAQPDANAAGNRQRRPQQHLSSDSRATTLVEGENNNNNPDNNQGASPFVFSYGQPANSGEHVRGSGGQSSAATTNTDTGSNQLIDSGAPQLSPEVMSNLAQLESLFAYNQPGRQASNEGGQAAQSGAGAQFRAPKPSVESLAFTADDAKFQPMIPMQPPATRHHKQEPIIRVQVPDQRGNQHRLGRPAGQQQQQVQVQRQQQSTRGQQQFNDINSYLPYLEGDVRQPVGQRLQAQQQPAQRGQASGTFQRGPNQQLQNNQAVASNTRQQFVAQPVETPDRSEELRVAGRQVNRGQQQQVRPQQQSARGLPGPQQRRRPPNRDRGQRVNAIDFPTSMGPAQSSFARALSDGDRPRSLVLLTSGPPNTDLVGDVQPQPGVATDESLLSDRALEERLRLLEAGYPLEPATSTGSSGSQQRPATDSATAEPISTRQSTGQFNNNGFFYQPTLSSTSVLATTTALSATSPTESRQMASSSTAASRDSFSRDLPSGRLSSSDEVTDVSDVPSNEQDTQENNNNNNPNGQLTAAALMNDQSGPGASLDPQSGKLVCNRRGVFAHPNSCGQFIVCAPQSRAQRSLRPFEHHCPAEHIFHDSWGRCRPRSLQSDISKLCRTSG